MKLSPAQDPVASAPLVVSRGSSAGWLLAHTWHVSASRRTSAEQAFIIVIFSYKTAGKPFLSAGASLAARQQRRWEEDWPLITKKQGGKLRQETSAARCLSSGSLGRSRRPARSEPGSGPKQSQARGNGQPSDVKPKINQAGFLLTPRHQPCFCLAPERSRKIWESVWKKVLSLCMRVRCRSSSG